MTHKTPLALTFAALLLAACGGTTPEAAGDTAPPAGQAVVVTVSPGEAEVAPEGTLKLGAQVTGTANGSVTWQVVEADGGSVDASGLYTAPAAEGTFHVRATSLASATSTGSSVVRVKKGTAAQVLVAVDPATATVPAGGSRSFTAAVTGTATRTVTWTVQGTGCGSVSAAGVYTAPNAGATCTVVATSAADATKSGTASVTVTPPPPHVVTVTPAVASVLTGGTTTFVANVTGTTAGESTAVTWSVPAGSGTINASTGVYVAPGTAGTYVVTATSVATPSGTATATVTVTAPPPPPPPVAIAISPTSAALDACTGQLFAATVTNSPNTSVTWTILDAGGGSVVNGAYVAPETPGTYRVRAASVADPTKTVVATVTVGPEKVLGVTVTPGSGTVLANGTLALAATVTTSCGTFPAQ